MEKYEIEQRLYALRESNRSAALAPYAAHELGETEEGPFVKAAMERNPVSRAALEGASRDEVLARIVALSDESIYDGPSRLAQPDEAWNFGRGDGLEKCLLAANVLGGTEIRVCGGQATLMDGETVICTFPTVKCPCSTVWRLSCKERKQNKGENHG
jgi:hypothetical protein